MSNAVLIIGNSGTGKSASIRTLPPEETFILNVIDKPLPFKGWRKSYTLISSATNPTGNYFSSDNHEMLKQMINYVNTRRPEIKYLVIDDFGYTMANHFMRRALQKGYDKFSEIGFQAGEIIDLITKGLRKDLFCFVMMHVETDKQGISKPKTVGNMIDQYICIEGKFTYVLHTIVADGKYYFLVNNDGIHTAKTGIGTFDAPAVENDLLMVANKIREATDEGIAA
jgi:hypothetical protein